MKILLVEIPTLNGTRWAVTWPTGTRLSGRRKRDRSGELLEGPEAPNMALLDWMLPGLDGIDVCRRIRKMERERLTSIP